MKTKITLLVLLITISVTKDSSDSKIQDKSYEFYQKKRSLEIRETCKLDQLAAYGLFGDAESLSEPNTICPNIKQNCCGNQDVERIKKFWYRDRKRIEHYHRTVLLIYKWILGYGKQINLLAQQLMEDYEKKIDPEGFMDGYYKRKLWFGINSNLYCYKAAKEILTLDFETEEKVEAFYWAITQKIEFIENTRKNFYCMLCSVEGQQSIHTSPAIYSWLYNKRVYYADSFCNMYVDKTLTISYQKWTTFNDYITDFLKITTCFTPQKNEEQNKDGKKKENDEKTILNSKRDPNFLKDVPVRRLTYLEEQIFKNPLNLENTSLMAPCDEAFGNYDYDHLYIFCDFWCQSFNIAKAVSIHDGDLKAMYKLYKYMKPLKIYFSSNKSHFNNDMVLMEKDIEQNYRKAPKSGLFYKSISKVVDLSQYKSDFVFHHKGINPLIIGDRNHLHFEYEIEGVLKVWFFTFLFFFL